MAYCLSVLDVQVVFAAFHLSAICLQNHRAVTFQVRVTSCKMMSTIFFTDEISSSVFTPPTAEMLSFAYSTATSFILSSKADKLKYDFSGQSNVRMTFNRYRLESSDEACS